MHKKTDNNKSLILIALFFGVVGGLTASLFIFSLNKFPTQVLETGHPILSSPFLTFSTIIILIIIFHKPIQSLLSRGQVSFKWGDKEISLSEIERNVDAEFNEFESKLSDLDSEIQDLKRTLTLTHGTRSEDETQSESRITRTQNIEKEDYSNKSEAEENKEQLNIIKKIRNVFDWVDSDKLASVVFHLGCSKYRWRNQKTLVKKTGIDSEDIDELIRLFPEYIIRSKGRSGNTIYRLSDKMKAKFIQITE